MRYRLLGPLEVSDGDHVVPIPRGRPHALLALLLIHANELMSAERLVDELWGESPPPTAGKALQVSVSRLRKQLGGTEEGAIVTRGNGYLLRAAREDVDARGFEDLLEGATRRLGSGDPRPAAAMLDEALALWRGPALAGLEYEPWAQQEIARLEELRIVGIETRAEAALALGEHAALVGQLEGLVREHPLRERLRAQLMLSLYRSGRQAEALEAYREARRELADLGLEPGDELRQLEEAILRHDPGLDRPADASRPKPGRKDGPGESMLVAPRGLDGLEGLLALAEPLAAGPARPELVIAIVVPGDRLGPVTAELAERRDELLDRGLAARTAAFSSPTPGHDLARLAGEDSVDLLLSDTGTDPLGGETGVLLANAPCDVALLVEGGGSRREGAVVVPFGAAWHDWAALRLGALLAQATDAPLRLIGATAGGGANPRDASRLLADASLIVQQSAGIMAEPLLGTPGREGIMALAGDAGMLVVGLSERWMEEGLGPVRTALATAPPAPTLLVRRGNRGDGIAPQQERTRLGWSLTG